MCMRIAPETADLSVRLSVKRTEQLEQSFIQPQGDRAGSQNLRDVDSVRLTQIVPDIHLSAQSADLDDRLTKEVIGLPLELLLHAGLDVVILIPNAHLDAVRGVVTFAKETEPNN